MNSPEKPAETEDGWARANEIGGAAESRRDAEARVRRLEEIRQAVIEEWRWPDPESPEWVE